MSAASPYSQAAADAAGPTSPSAEAKQHDFQPPPQEIVNWAGIKLNAEEDLAFAVKGRPAFAFVDVYLRNGQKIMADYGAMVWMDASIHISTECTGGCCAACWRSCAGEGCCQNTYTGRELRSKVSFGFKLPGDMFPFVLSSGQGWLMAPGAFVAGTSNVVVSSKFMGCGWCCCSGEGPFLTSVSVSSGNGIFFAGKYGGLEFHDVPGGKDMYIDPGLFFAIDDQARDKIDFGLAGGCKTCLFGQQGFVIKIKGPCRVVTKTRNPRIFQDLIDAKKRQENTGAKGKGQSGGVSTGNEQADALQGVCAWVCGKVWKCVKKLLRRRRH